VRRRIRGGFLGAEMVEVTGWCKEECEGKEYVMDFCGRRRRADRATGGVRLGAVGDWGRGLGIMGLGREDRGIGECGKGEWGRRRGRGDG